MTKEEIHASLDAMLTNPKARNFLNHLVRAYFPITNMTTIKLKQSAPIKCVLTGAKLLSHQEIDEIYASEEFKNKTKDLISISDEDKQAEVLKIFAVISGNRVEGCTGKVTTTFMSHNANQAFVDWVITKSLKADKHINWLLGSIRRASFIERAESINDSDVQKKVQNFKKKGSNTATFRLDESTNVLAKLKSDLEAKGK